MTCRPGPANRKRTPSAIEDRSTLPMYPRTVRRFAAISRTPPTTARPTSIGMAFSEMAGNHGAWANSAASSDERWWYCAQVSAPGATPSTTM